MTKYTIEDIEILRQKGGLSYEEAVNLLEYHSGSLAQALVDLEKNGRLKGDSGKTGSHKGGKGLFSFLYRLRIHVKKAQISIINLSALFMLVVLCVAPHVLVIGLIAALALGYRITIERDSRDFAFESFDDVVKNAKSNVKNTIGSFTRQFAPEEETSQQEQPSKEARSESAPSGTRPVNVPFPGEGSVDVHDGGDGYHEADIQ